MNVQTPPPPPASSVPPENVGVVVIHGVGEAEIGWINDYIIDELAKREPTMGLDPYSQVYRLPDKGRTVPGKKFRTVVRRARIADRVDVSFAELHWADFEIIIPRLIKPARIIKVIRDRRPIVKSANHLRTYLLADGR